MTREQISKDYNVDENGIIRTLGKFEGEMLYVPFYWDQAMQGMFAEDVAGVFFLPFDKDEHLMFPELDNAYGIGLEESEQGFVYAQVYDTQAEYNAAVERCEKIEESEIE